MNDRRTAAAIRTRPIEPWNGLDLPDLYSRLAGTGLVGRLLELARDEDLGPVGIDLTGAAVGAGAGGAGAEGEQSRVRLAAREAGVCAGLAVVPELLRVFGVDVGFEPTMKDGDRFDPGAHFGTFSGSLTEMVRIERTMLNLVSRLSGIATRTALFEAAMRAAFTSATETDGAGEAHPARLYDTRKTTPGLRVLEKYAVRCGGGFCHRLGLHDAVMFKDNHIAGIPHDRLAARARELAREARGTAAAAGIVPAFVCFEVDDLDQFDALLTIEPGVVDIVLLDNMPPATLREAVGMRDAARSTVALEASGGVSLETIGAVAASGVDRVSVGGLTHQAVSIDLGFDAVARADR